ncbi:MAG: hypothetical protein ACRENI_02535 [Gemmatimonadaceae bacterium]
MRRGTIAVAAATLLSASLATAAPRSMSAQVTPAPGAPPPAPCVIVFVNTPETQATSSRTPEGGYDTFLGGGVVAHCQNQDVHLRADSAEYYESRGVIYLIGDVHYTEPRLVLDSRRLTYFMPEERLVAEGDVVAVLPSGTTMRGPRSEYFRAVPGARPTARMIATGRPRFELVQGDSTGRPREPVELIADRVVMDGDSLVYASGDVEIMRPDVVARGDSAFLDSGREFARLMRDPVIEGKGERPFRLTGFRIDLFSERRTLRRVLAQGEANAVSGELDLRSDTLDLRLTDSRLETAFAWGPTRAIAVTPSNELVADSLHIVMPGQRLQEVRALGNAFAQGMPDSTVVRSTQRDWLRGDTIIALFDTTDTVDSTGIANVAPDSAGNDDEGQPKIRQLVATGSARSFQQLPATGSDAGSDIPPAQPAINYVRGREITVAFRDQEVATVTVVDGATGVYMEPVPVVVAPPAATPAPENPPG